MVLHILRAAFVLLMAAVGWYLLAQPWQPFGRFTWLSLMITIVVAVAIIGVDILAPRKKLAVFSGTFLGLIVGLFIAYAASFVIKLLLDQAEAAFPNLATYLASKPAGVTDVTITNRALLLQSLNLLVGITCSYLAISFILQTKDDFRFIIPYVEFTKQIKGARPMLLDTSVLIDGRINDIASTGILDTRLIAPRFVLAELQLIADSGDKLKRNRGRRGLDVLARLQNNRKIEVVIYEGTTREDDSASGVDEKLLTLAHELGARVLTNDFNLNKVAQLRGVDVININDLATALKPVVLPGERMTVRIIKAGEEAGQGVGYLEDGTMVVVEQARAHLNDEIEFVVTSALQTSAGKMIFGRMGESAVNPQGRAATAKATPSRGNRPDNAAT